MKKKTWLQQKEQRQSVSQGIMFLIATVALIFVLFQFGVPALVKLAGFFGDLKSATQSVEKNDTIAPLAPRFDYVPEYTQSETVNLSGNSEAGSIIKVFHNNAELQELIADKDGRFSLDQISLELGENTFWASAWDQAGNASQESEPLTITLDKEPPVLEVSQPKADDRFFDKDKQIKVTGFTEAEAKVMVNDRLAIVDHEGQFSTTLVLNDGQNDIRVTATDKANNQTETTIQVEYIPWFFVLVLLSYNQMVYRSELGLVTPEQIVTQIEALGLRLINTQSKFESNLPPLTIWVLVDPDLPDIILIGPQRSLPPIEEMDINKTSEYGLQTTIEFTVNNILGNQDIKIRVKPSLVDVWAFTNSQHSGNTHGYKPINQASYVAILFAIAGKSNKPLSPLRTIIPKQ